MENNDKILLCMLENQIQNLFALSFKTITILIGYSGIFLVFSSNFIMDHEGSVLAKPGKGNPGK
jgi:hypothetical protein